MSHINDLINHYCPDGVPFKKLGEVGEFIRGNGLQKKELQTEGFPAIHYGQIHTYYGISATVTKSFVSPETAQKLRHARPGDLLIATTSEDDDAVGKATAWLGQSDVALSGDAYIYRHRLNPTYVSYFFQSLEFQEKKRRYITGTKVRRLSGSSLAKIQIPVPPLPVQEEIVRILDTFTQMEAELETELEARKQQYEYYSATLTRITDRKVPCIPLKDIASYSKNRIDATELDETSYVGVDNLLPNKAGRVDSQYFPTTTRLTQFHPGNILIGNIRPYLQKIWISDRTGGASGDVLTIQLSSNSKGKILPKFLFHVLSTQDFFFYNMKHAKGAKMPRGDKTAIMQFKIPLLPLEEQHRIVFFLDRLRTLTISLQEGLPAEIEARRQQYEYYRDQLLSFPEKKEDNEDHTEK